MNIRQNNNSATLLTFNKDAKKSFLKNLLYLIVIGVVLTNTFSLIAIFL